MWGHTLMYASILTLLAMSISYITLSCLHYAFTQYKYLYAKIWSMFLYLKYYVLVLILFHISSNFHGEIYP